jgi:hypothetical protein
VELHEKIENHAEIDENLQIDTGNNKVIYIIINKN